MGDDAYVARGEQALNWLYTKRSILCGTMMQDIQAIDKFNVIYIELAELLRSNAKAWLFIQRMTGMHTLVLWASVKNDRKSDWLANFAMAKTVARAVKHRKADLILHTPTDPIYSDWAKELGVPCIQTWLAFPFARSVAPVKRSLPIIADCRWDLNANGSFFRRMLTEVANASIVPLRPSESSDIRLSKLAAASILQQIPIMLKDDSTFWRTITLGKTDCSIYASAPIAFDEDGMMLLERVSRSDWKEFKRAWIKAWSLWAERMREFWDEEILRERFKDEVGLTLPPDLTPIHHFYLLAS